MTIDRRRLLRLAGSAVTGLAGLSFAQRAGATGVHPLHTPRTGADGANAAFQADAPSEGARLEGAPLEGASAASHPLPGAGPGQAPGFYRFRHGPVIVTVLNDGLQPWDLKRAVLGVPEAQVAAALKAHRQPRNALALHMNAVMIEVGAHRLLIDAGFGVAPSKSAPGPATGDGPPVNDAHSETGRHTAGVLAANLAAAGHAPDDIDTVVFTHGHMDHLGGAVLPDAKIPRFARATHVMAAAEIAHWQAKAAAGAGDAAGRGSDPARPVPARMIDALTAQMMPVDLPPAEEVAQMPLEAWITSGVDLPIDGGGRIGERTATLRMLPIPGHTPGHAGVLIEASDDAGPLLIAGDALMHFVLSLNHPGWHNGFDEDPALAAAMRARLLDLAAEADWRVFGYHMPFPGIGRIARRGRGYEWVPDLWAPMVV